MDIINLPDSSLSCILERLPFEDRWRSRRVCTKWARVISFHDIIHLDLGTFTFSRPRKSKQPRLKSNNNNNNNNKPCLWPAEPDLSANNLFLDELLGTILPISGFRLQSVTIRHLHQLFTVTETTLQLLTQFCPSLRYISTGLNSRWFHCGSLPEQLALRLQTLHVTRIGGAAGELISQVNSATAFPALRNMGFESVPSTAWSTVIRLATPALKTLHVPSGPGRNMSSNDFQAICTSNPNLETLSLRHSGALTNIEPLLSLDNLKRLDLSLCSRIVTTSDDSTFHRLTLKLADTLTHLNISKCPGIENFKFLSPLLALEYLNVQQTSFSIAHLDSCLNPEAPMKQLVLDSTPAAGTDGLSLLASKFSKFPLVSLEAYPAAYSRSTDKDAADRAATALVNTFRATLEMLDLSNHVDITDSFLDNIDVSGTKLKFLNLEGTQCSGNSIVWLGNALLALNNNDQICTSTLKDRVVTDVRSNQRNDAQKYVLRITGSRHMFRLLPTAPSKRLSIETQTAFS